MTKPKNYSPIPMPAEQVFTPKPIPKPTNNDTDAYPFLVKTLITFTKLNTQGNEEKFKDEVVFKLDRPAATMPWYALRNYLVPRYLTKKYGPFEVAWQRIYEITIIKLINRINPEDITGIPLRVMTTDQLEEYCRRWELRVPVREFYSVEKAREMVALRLEDPKGFEHHLREYREGKKRAYPELDAIRKKSDSDDVIEDSGQEFEALDKKQNSSMPNLPAEPEPEIKLPKPSKPFSNKKRENTMNTVNTADDINPFSGV